MANRNIYKKGGGGGLGSYIIVIKRTGTGSAFETETPWRKVLDSYANAETLYLSVVELDDSFRVLNVDYVRANNQLKLLALDSERNKLYTLTSDRQGWLSITETDAGGGSISGDITYEEI